MKMIGLVGGTGWVSTAEYYRLINEKTNERLGGLHFARCVLYSFDFAEIQELHRDIDRPRFYARILDASQKLIHAGADCILLCANTMHMFADDLEREIDVPLIHIAKATATQIREAGLSKVGLLGTKLTMELDFYKEKLARAGVEVLTPDEGDRNFIQDTIMSELLKSVFRQEARSRFLGIMGTLASRGAQGIVLGCTEIPLLVRSGDTDMPLFDTTDIHSTAAVEFALSGE